MVALVPFSLFDILLSGLVKDFIFAPTGGTYPSGILNLVPYFLFNLSPIVRVNSKCCVWSSPIGTTLAL